MLYEGVFNRDVCHRLGLLMELNGIAHSRVYHPWKDTPLSERVAKANSHADPSTLPVYLSIHANAGKGTGVEVFTYFGESASDHLATHLCEAFKQEMPYMAVRKDLSDGDSDKEAAFYVLKHTTCPAILSENGFMDHQEDYRRLHDPDYRQQVAACHLLALKNFAHDLPF